MGFEQMLVESVDQGLARALGRKIELELLENRREKYGSRDLGIQYQRDIGLLGQLLEERSHERRLARADLARELDEAAAVRNTVDQVRQRVGMALAQIEVARIGRDRKRLLSQAKELRVHRLGSAAPVTHQLRACFRVIP